MAGTASLNGEDPTTDPSRNQTLLIALIIIEGALLITCCGVCVWKYYREKRVQERTLERRRQRSEQQRRRSELTPNGSRDNLTSQDDSSSKTNLSEHAGKAEETHQSQKVSYLNEAAYIASKIRSNPTMTKSSLTSMSQKTRTAQKENTSVTTTTMARSDVELSIPGYLEVQYGQDFTVSRLLTKGGAASVYLGKTDHLRLRKYGKVIVVKQLQPNAHTPDALVRDAFHQELAIMWYFRESEYFIKVLGYTEQPMSFVSKFYPDGSLDRLLRKKKFAVTKKLIATIAKGIAAAISSMHSAGFIHCDLKSGNILIDRNTHNEIVPVLSDFGISQIMDASTMLVKDFPVIYNNAFSFNYAAPEVFYRMKRHESVADVSGEVGKALDVYSYGCILYELLVQYPPWTIVK